MKYVPYSLLLAASLLALPFPARADRIESWRFDAQQNRLEFQTDQPVQPEAQLVPNPTRLVIDLPGIRLGRPSYTEPVTGGGPIRSVRFGQFTPDKARIVVELAPGYTLDPAQVKFRGITAQQWQVQLPQPQAIAPTTSPPVATPPNPAATAAAAATLQGVRVTADGFFLQTTGQPTQVRQSRSADGRQIFLDLAGTAIAPGVRPDQTINSFGVSRIQFAQTSASPPVTRVTLNVAPNSPNWLASASRSGGVVVLPQGGVAALPDRRPTPRPATPAPQPTLATITSVSLERNNGQLLIRADRPVQYTSGWDRATASYRIAIQGAKLADQVQGPQLPMGSPILRLRLRQENPQTVVILLQPAAGILIKDEGRPNQPFVAFALERNQPTLAAPVVNPPQANIPVPKAPPSSPTPTPMPTIPQGRIVVMIDPGHGGPDPGAVGIGGLREKDVVLDISRQVAALLERQGIAAVLTRGNDMDLDLEPRVQMAERSNAAVFVSIHANAISMSRPEVNGLETYYYNSGAELARVIHQAVLEQVPIRDRSVRQARFYVLRRTSMPAVLVETGFVTGREDAPRLANAAHRRKMAEAIATGILRYVQRSVRR